MKSMSSTLDQTSEERVLEILVDQAPVGVCIIQDGRFCYANYYFLATTGYTLDELMDKDSIQ
jgi:PAS domain S-box-containing protein